MEKFDEKFYMGMLDDALTVGLPIISRDTAARLMAITYVYGGGNETLILSPKFQCDCKYIQKRFGIQGGEIPDAEFASTLRSYVKELENSKVCPQWVHDLMKRRYNIKLSVQ